MVQKNQPRYQLEGMHTWQTKQNKKKPMPKPTIENKIDPED
jgi:hypothetical protein